MNNSKSCKFCKQIKPLSNFTKDRTQSGGYQPKCKACRAISAKQWRKNNPEYVPTWLAANPKYLTQWRAKNFWYTAERQAISKAKRYGCDIYFIRKRDFRRLFQNRCFTCGTEDELTIDHIIPLSRGGNHGIGNLQILCKSCNSRKGAKTIYEWKMSEMRG